MNTTLQRLFRYKAWADHELLSALGELGQDHPVTPLAIKALSHTYVVDRIFAAHLRGERHEYGSSNLSEMPTLADLSADIKRSDWEYVEYVSALGSERLAEPIAFTFTDGAAGQMTREEMLMHVITHGVGHRGQISTVMLMNGQAPAVDGFATYLHTAEAEPRRPTG